MKENKFPTYSETRRTAEKGVTLVKMTIENELNWIFRTTHLEDDFGVDGYLDIIGSNNSVTGKYLAVQIKTGKSYFKSEKSYGWEFYGENKHLNYYLNLTSPILIILVDIDSKKIYWEEFDINKITKRKNRWSMIIPKYNELNNNSKEIFEKLSGDVIDYMPQIEHQWEISKQLKNSLFTYLNVNKTEILNKDVSGFTTILKKLTSDEEIIKKAKGTFTFFIDGYNNDKRELFQIEEVREWIKLVIPAFKYWGYFLNMKDSMHTIAGLRVLHFCSVDIEIVEPHDENNKYKTAPDPDQSLELMKELFLWLNEFCLKYSIPHETNVEQSNLISNGIFGFDGNNIPK